jgi:hypothetical protein
VRESSIEIEIEPELARKMREKRDYNSDNTASPEKKVTKEQLLGDSEEEDVTPVNNKLFTQHVPLLGKTPLCKCFVFTVFSVLRG